MSFSTTTPHKPRPPPGQQGSTPFRSASASKFRSSLVPMNRPSSYRARDPPTKVTGSLATERDIFRTSTPRAARTTPFSPNIPAEATRMGSSVRKFAPQRSAHGGMSSTASAELFKMRIPSPDPALTGEALAKEVPDDPNRKGSVYADQFLAHKCPPGFDDLQRRQFFCILDLRRLKYAADEIFAKKDWKLNILNFAKEYEKSRGLIMLRYGLYEFKNVKPSEEVLKKWRAAHGLPDPEPQESTTSASSGQASRRNGLSNGAGPTKRKAEDDLTPKDNALMASTANQNKRRNMEQEPTAPVLTGPAPFKKSKRKAEETDEPDENQPSKLQRPTASPATSKFESILNKAQNGLSSPLKRSAPISTPLGAQKSTESSNMSFTPKSNPFGKSTNGVDLGITKTTNGTSASGSVLSGHEFGSTPTTTGGNIFSYLSESSANNSGNENGSADEDDTDSESGPESEENRDAAPSDGPSAVASAGTSTPPTQIGSSLFPMNKASNTPNILGGLAKPSDLASKGGLFGRVKMGANGQPLRATPDLDVKEDDSTAEPPAAESQQSKTPASKPGDYTFNPSTTPISFSQPSSTTPKPPTSMSSKVPTAEPTKVESVSTANALSISKQEAQPTQPSQSTMQALFGTPSSSKPKSTEATSSIFDAPKSAPATSGLFGATPAKQLFGKVSDSDATASKEAKTPAQPKPLFGSAKVEEVSSTPVGSTPEFKALFGGSTQKVNSTITNNAVSNSGLFGKDVKSPATSLFGANSNSPLFGGKTNAGAPEGTKPIFGTPNKQLSSSFTFGSSKPEETSETSKSSNAPDQGKTQPPETPAAKPLFGAQVSKSFSATPTPLFGNSQAAPIEKKPEESITTKTGLFSNNNSNNGAPASNGSIFNFGAQPSPATNNSQPSPAPSFSFGANSNAVPAFSFGASQPQTNGNNPKKIDFQFGSSTPSASTTTPFTFGQDTSANSSFTFTAGGNGPAPNNPFSNPGASSSAPKFGGNGNSAMPTPPSSFNFSFGQQAPSTPNTVSASQSSTLFGGSFNGTSAPPSFNFTQATPSQNPPSTAGSKPAPATSGVFSFLQAGGETSTGANSPFPAPSSIGTTPVNGTPEPQTQNEDGEEAPQEQLSLTEGGPGEEDEIILHEVRAKAIKYVPVSKDSDDDQAEKSKSPWSTQGVGPLRVLKNKSTGTVRILLRAEPRGHIAMNKTILSDIAYKAKDKTLNFVAASDDGSCLETWVLQVKKPEFAQELAAVLEANKSANKK